jgi:solute carrier family 8 (sodium/calcium exchanger)
MESIEMITSLKVEVKYSDPSLGEEITKKVPFWNATIANLTLMALGSSAPEIILAVLDTSTKLGKCPGELGAATIVGSAAFNLLVISAVSIYAVTGDPK